MNSLKDGLREYLRDIFLSIINKEELAKNKISVYVRFNFPQYLIDSRSIIFTHS